MLSTSFGCLDSGDMNKTVWTDIAGRQRRDITSPPMTSPSLLKPCYRQEVCTTSGVSLALLIIPAVWHQCSILCSAFQANSAEKATRPGACCSRPYGVCVEMPNPAIRSSGDWPFRRPGSRKPPRREHVEERPRSGYQDPGPPRSPGQAGDRRNTPVSP